MSQATAANSTQPDLLDNAADWRLSLRAANRSSATIDTYLSAVRLLDHFLAERAMPRRIGHIRREHIEAFIADLVERQSPGTAANRYRSLQQFFRWAATSDDDEARGGGLIKSNPMANMRPPTVPENPPPVLRDTELKSLLDTCRKGSDLASARDFAILQLLIRTGIRRGELVALRYSADDPSESDFDRDQQLIHVIGKGKRARPVYLDPEAMLAMRRYLRARRDHPRADLPWLWLGHRGRLDATGVYQMVRRRGQQAGLPDAYVHLFRHSAAHYAMASGMAEGDVMKQFGWRSSSMLRRYGESAAIERSLASQKSHARGRL